MIALLCMCYSISVHMYMLEKVKDKYMHMSAYVHKCACICMYMCMYVCILMCIWYSFHGCPQLILFLYHSILFGNLCAVIRINVVECFLC